MTIADEAYFQEDHFCASRRPQEITKLVILLEKQISNGKVQYSYRLTTTLDMDFVLFLSSCIPQHIRKPITKSQMDTITEMYTLLVL